MTEIVLFLHLFRQRFVLVDYSENFVITLNYDKDQFGHLIAEFVRYIFKELQQSELRRYGLQEIFLRNYSKVNYADMVG